MSQQGKAENIRESDNLFNSIPPSPHVTVDTSYGVLANRYHKKVPAEESVLPGQEKECHKSVASFSCWARNISENNRYRVGFLRDIVANRGACLADGVLSCQILSVHRGKMIGVAAPRR